MIAAACDVVQRSSVRRDGNREARVQAEIVWWLREAVPDAVVYAVPNDGLFSKREAARRRWIGVLAGIPDVAIIDGRGRPFFLEVKAPGRYPEPEQRACMQRLTAAGACCAVVRSLDEVKEIAARWGLVNLENAA